MAGRADDGGRWCQGQGMLILGFVSSILPEYIHPELQSSMVLNWACRHSDWAENANLATNVALPEWLRG